MQSVQKIHSADISQSAYATPINIGNTFVRNSGISPQSGGPKRFSERQQQVLLVLIGAVWMGLSLASLTFAALSTNPSAGPGIAKEAPAELTKPASYTPPANPPMAKPAKAVQATAATSPAPTI